jgi:hypothetical protein
MYSSRPPSPNLPHRESSIFISYIFNSPNSQQYFNMLASELLPLIKAYWPIILVVGVVLRLARNKFYNGLNKYPGHPLAGYTNWWRYFDVQGRKAQWTHIDLHRKHGDIVRLGPNVLSFADPRAIKTIYGLNKGMTKVRISLATQLYHFLSTSL